MDNDESSKDFPNVLSCSALDLAEYLLKNRFKNGTKDTISFLMMAARSLPGSEKIMSEMISQESNADAKSGTQTSASTTVGGNNALPDLGPSLLYPPDEEGAEDAATDQPIEVSVVAPRSKYNLHIQERGLVFKHPKKDSENFVVSSEGVVDKIVVFPKPESCRRTTSSSKNTPAGDMVLMSFHDDILIGKKKYPQVCFQLPTSFTVQRDDNVVDGDAGDEQPLQGTDLWVELLCESLRIDRVAHPEQVIRVPNPTERSTKRWSGDHDEDRFTFSSAQEAGTSTTTGGMPFVKCYHGIQDGVLYPLKEGLLFFKPPLFIPRGRLVSIASGRGATASTTGTSARYFDIIVKVQEKDVPENEYTEEFTGIAREELQVLNQYIQRILIPAMKRDAGETTNEASQADDDEDEEDQPPTRHTPGKRTPRRQASVKAQRISRSQMENGEDDEEDDDDDDEEDYNGNKAGGGDAEEEDDDNDDDDEEDDEDFEEAMVDRGDNDAEDDEDEDDDDDDDWAGGKSPSKKRRIS